MRKVGFALRVKKHLKNRERRRRREAYSAIDRIRANPPQGDIANILLDIFSSPEKTFLFALRCKSVFGVRKGA